MPDKWIYYLVLIILLIVMLALGFFIGYLSDSGKSEIKDKITMLEKEIEQYKSNLQEEAKTIDKLGKELDAYKETLTNYMKNFGKEGEKLLEKFEEEEKLSKLRISIIQKIHKWLVTRNYPLPRSSAELDMTTAEFEEWNNSLRFEIPE